MDMEYISLQGCIRNTSIDTSVLTEHWLNTCSGPWLQIQGNWLKQKRSIWGYWRKVKQMICDSLNRVRNTQTVCIMTVCAPDWDTGPLMCMGLGAGAWRLESNPGMRTAVDCREMAWGEEGRKSETENAFGEKPGGNGSRVLLLSHVLWVEPPL